MADGHQIQDLVVAFVRAFGLHHPEQTPCGQPLSVSEAHALTELGQAPAMRQGDLAIRLQLDKSTVSRLVHQLEQRGWVVRQGDPHDGRATLLRLSDAGHRVAQQIAAARAAKFDQLLAALGPEDREVAARGLSALLRGLHTTQGEQTIADQSSS